MSEKGKIVLRGMGGLLNPPTHPEHTSSVETDLMRRPENRGSMSLSTAAECEWLDAATRAEARRKLESWVAPPIESPEVQEWILQVLGYFNGCYRAAMPEPECWHMSNLVMGKGAEEGKTLDDHAGVHLIRKYYPGFTPTPEHLAAAYWGDKPKAV